MRKRAAFVALFALVTALLAPAVASANVAPCEKAVLGHGPPNWRQLSVTAGPVGVFKHPLARMQRTGNGLVAKMPLLVEGQAPVTVSVPPRLRGRVFLYYGTLLDRNGHPSPGFANARGYEETHFEPCAGRTRTPWPGGIRVKGTKPVQLEIAVEGGGIYQLHLGRPRVSFPPQD
jgi:hypothetical protein